MNAALKTMIGKGMLKRNIPTNAAAAITDKHVILECALADANDRL